jgi:hypothetical protein
VIRRLHNVDPGYVVALLLPLIGILPTLGYGVIDTADGPLHVQRIQAMSILLGEGNLWPRWVPWFHLGFGYPIFNFYPPGVFTLGGLLGQLGIPATVAFTIVAALAWMIGSVGMYHLARRFMPGAAALLACALWAYAPSRLFEVWDQGSLPQMMAAAWVPWLISGIIAAAYAPSRRRALGIALPLAGVVLSHQPITFISALYVAPLSFIVPLWAAHRAGGKLLSRYVSVFGGLALGAGLAAAFLLPLFGELRFVQAAGGAEDNLDYLISNFLQPAEIFAQPAAMDLTDLRFELPTTLGLIGGLLAVPGLLALAKRRQWGLLVLLLAGLGFTLFMLLEVSLPVWVSIPLFEQLRFPERFLRVGAVLLALAGGASILILPRRWQTGGMVVGLIAVLVAALPMIYPNQRFLPWGNLTAQDEIAFEVANFTWGTTSYDEFDPIWGEDIPLPLDVPEVEEYATNPLRIYVNRVDMARYGDIMQVEQVGTAASQVTLTQEHAVRFHQYYYPGWTATLGGEPVEIIPDEQFGLITVTAPAGTHVIELAYVGTPLQHLGEAVTLASMSVVLVLAFTSRRQPRSGAAEAGVSSRLALGVSAAVIVFAVVNTAILTPNTLLFRHRSTPDQPVAMQTPVGAKFGDDFTLLGFTLEQSSVAPGGLFAITLYWQPQREISTMFRPVVQLVNLPLTAAYGASEPFFPGGGHSVGYPPDRFASEVHELRVFADAPPYVARVSVQMVDAATGEPLRLPDGSDRVLLEPLIRIEGSDTGTTDALQVTFDNSIALHCVDVARSDDHYTLDFYWHVETTPAHDVVLFAHGLDASGEVIQQADAPPLDGEYPTSLWQPGQDLISRITLPYDAAITSFAVGLYAPNDGARLPAAQGETPLPDNRVVLSLEGTPCP